MKPATTFGQVLGQVVIAHRRSKSATQLTMAKKLDLSQSAFSRLERGEAAFNVPQLLRTAAALGVTVSKMFEQAEKGAAALSKGGVTVLEEAPAEDDRARWAWVAAKVIEAKVQTVVARVGYGYDYTKVKTKEEEHVPVYVRGR